jgi:hypothetical protein
MEMGAQLANDLRRLSVRPRSLAQRALREIAFLSKRLFACLMARTLYALAKKAEIFSIWTISAERPRARTAGALERNVAARSKKQGGE